MSELLFRPLVGYETSHIISNKGEIISLNYNKTGKPKVIKQNKNKDGYMIISLYDWNNKRVNTHYVHRLVALTFLPNPNNLKCVNHKDEDKPIIVLITLNGALGHIIAVMGQGVPVCLKPKKIEVASLHQKRLCV